MTFKQDGRLKDIPAVPGETYYANINVPHCVPLSKSPRLHLLGCVSDIDADKKGKDVTRHQAMGDSGITWADWKKDLCWILTPLLVVKVENPHSGTH